MDSSRITAASIFVVTLLLLVPSVDAFSFYGSPPTSSSITTGAASYASSSSWQLRMAADQEQKTFDVSIPYDAAARLAFDEASDSGDTTFEEFEVKYLAEAIELVKSKQNKEGADQAPTTAAGVTDKQSTSPISVEGKGRTNALNGLPGNTRPIEGFDPLNLAEVGSDETLAWFRAAELKHSRVAMLAATGYIVQASGFHFPGMLSGDVSFASLSEMKPFDAWDAVPDNVKSIILFFAFFSEVSSESSGTHYMKGGNLPEVVFPKFDFSAVDEKTMTTKRSRELNNGRLAMIGIISFIAANNVPGSVPALAGLDMF